MLMALSFLHQTFPSVELVFQSLVQPSRLSLVRLQVMNCTFRYTLFLEYRGHLQSDPKLTDWTVVAITHTTVDEGRSFARVYTKNRKKITPASKHSFSVTLPDKRLQIPYTTAGLRLSRIARNTIAIVLDIVLRTRVVGKGYVSFVHLQLHPESHIRLGTDFISNVGRAAATSHALKSVFTSVGTFVRFSRLRTLYRLPISVADREEK